MAEILGLRRGGAGQAGRLLEGMWRQVCNLPLFPASCKLAATLVRDALFLVVKRRETIAAAGTAGQAVVSQLAQLAADWQELRRPAIRGWGRDHQRSLP